MRVLRVFILLAVPWLAHADNDPASLPFSAQQVGDAKVIYVDFWASWCGPCRRSFPWLNEMQAKYGDQGFAVVAVNVDPERADAQRFLEAYPAQFALTFDPQGELASRYQLQGMPSAVLLAADGTELSRHVGFQEKHKRDYEQEIVRLLQTRSMEVNP